jgi:hypothetical protein
LSYGPLSALPPNRTGSHAPTQAVGVAALCAPDSNGPDSLIGERARGPTARGVDQFVPLTSRRPNASRRVGLTLSYRMASVRLAGRACARMRWAPVLPGPHVLLILLSSAWSLLGGARWGDHSRAAGLAPVATSPRGGLSGWCSTRVRLTHPFAHWSIGVNFGQGRARQGVPGVGPGVRRQGL